MQVFYKILFTNTCIRVIIYTRGEDMRDKDLLKAFLRDGWEEVRIHGSHHIIKKGNQTETIPVHGKDVAPGLLNAILKRTGLKIKK